MFRKITLVAVPADFACPIVGEETTAVAARKFRISAARIRKVRAWLKQTIPFPAFDSQDPADFWMYMDAYERQLPLP
jgi:hypothetical protein